MEAGNKASEARINRRKITATKSGAAAKTGGASTSREGKAQHYTTGLLGDMNAEFFTCTQGRRKTDMTRRMWIRGGE